VSRKTDRFSHGVRIFGPKLLRKLMKDALLPAPPVGRTLESICITEACE